ncbi:Signal transduction histidine kinase [Nitrosospira sp. Nl5]|uniref:hybrid sensor histidine kinase/response regulator n=1 Tax=Nitrosospira sp. Nl5 TaxID=200120 RepID=UPI00087FEE38|nr:ATP-binding protein [Nitrosospira sp. Nl5]SCY01827.1 Signal transduction histidine kinase [Nitrosospira sp. Nl5]
MNIKSFTKFSNVALALLLTSIGMLVFHSLSIRDNINSNEHRRFRAILLADELLQSSEDLTNMARNYVITGDPLYKDYFFYILDIREGKRPRPLNYSATYWHLAAAGKVPTVDRGDTVPLLEMLRRENFKEEEFALLQEAKINSDRLVEVEREAFAALKGLYDDGRGNFTVRRAPNRGFAISLLFGEGYSAKKASIMAPIQKFRDLFNERMQAESNIGLARLERLLMSEMVLIFIALLATVVIVLYTRLGILLPLAELGRQVAGITRGIRPSRYGKATNNEVAELGEALVLADAEKRQLLEKERIARNEAERASQLKDEFLATLSHELRTPLNAILGWAQLILSGTMKNEDVRRGLETIERNARAQNKLIEDLLEMSSIISGKVRLDMQRLDIASLVEAAVESVNPTAQAKGIILQKSIDRRVSPISGDSNRLQQVFWNLLSNAIKFTPKGGRIEVVVEQIGSYLEIKINDSGMGISPEFMPYVFDRFRQADPSLTRQYGGLGLGLAIVKQLVELHGGTVRAESAGMGKGASFTVNLPLAAVSLSTNGKKEPLSLKRSPFDRANLLLPGIKVLVLDDEPDARDLIKQILIHCQASVIAVGTAREGLELLGTEKPDVIISDIGMPEKNGYQFIREVRSLPAERGGKIPAIALTAFARLEDRITAMAAGYQEYLTKPVEPQELVAAIDKLLEQEEEPAKP